MHISSSYAKILGETNFQPREIPEVGQKPKTEKKEREKERAKVGDNNGQTHGAGKHAWRSQAAWAKRPKVGNNNGQLRIATPPRVAHAKPPGPNKHLGNILCL